MHVEVDDHLTTVDVLVERAWVDDHLDRLAVWRRNVTAETVDGTAYYVSSFPSDETPTDHVLREYQAANRTMFTAGNRSFVDAPMGMYLRVDAEPGNVTIEPQVREGVDVSRVPLFVNRSYLASWNVTDPTVYDRSGKRLPMGILGNHVVFRANASSISKTDIQLLHSQDSAVNGTTRTCRNRTGYLTAWSHDRNGSSRSRLFTHNQDFCWEWDIWPGGNLSGNNLSHYQVRGRIIDRSDGEVYCRMDVPMRDLDGNLSFGAQVCHGDGPRPTLINASLRVHAISETASHDWSGEVRTVAGGSDCDGTGTETFLRTYHPSLIERDPVDELCGIDWVLDGDYGELAPDRSDYDEDQEAIVTNATRTLNVSEATEPYINVSDTKPLITDEVVAIFNGSIPENISEIVDDYGEVKLQNATLNMTVVRTYAADLVDDAIADLDNRTDTLGAHQARYYETTRQPNDPLYHRSSDNDVGQEAPDTIDLPGAWGYGWGDHCFERRQFGFCPERASIAILDSGINDAHPDLERNVQGDLCGGHANMISGKPPVDIAGHGTMVAGIASGVVNNDEGIAGSSNVFLTDIKVCAIHPKPNTKSICPGYAVALGIVYAYQLPYPYRVQIISMSLGCTYEGAYCGTRYSPVVEAARQARHNDRMLVAATGNDDGPSTGCDGDRVRWPARDFHVFAVGATRRDGGERWPKSSCGPDVDVVAPGEDITTTSYVGGIDRHVDQESEGYDILFSGTSAAAPWVSGVAALIWQLAPSDLDDWEVQDCLTRTADSSIGSTDAVGDGLINASAAADEGSDGSC